MPVAIHIVFLSVFLLFCWYFPRWLDRADAKRLEEDKIIADRIDAARMRPITRRAIGAGWNESSKKTTTHKW